MSTDMRAYFVDLNRILGFDKGEWALLLGASALVVSASFLLM